MAKAKAKAGVTDLVPAAGGVAAGVAAGPGLHPEPAGGASPQHVALRRPPYRHRPRRAPLAAVAPRLREHAGLLLLFLGSAALGHGPLHGLVLAAARCYTTPSSEEEDGT